MLRDSTSSEREWIIMTIPKPELDDRKFDDLVQESHALIPRYAQQWTDHNWSDPGVTFIDLFSWLTEISLYRINHITDRHRLKYLRLLGTFIQPAAPAHVELTIDPGILPSLPVPLLVKGSVVSAEISGNYVPFELDEDITISPLSLEKIIVDEGSSGVFDRTSANTKGDQFFAPFGMSGQADCILYLGFDFEPPVESLNIFFHLYDDDLKPVGIHGNEPPCGFRNTMVSWEYSTVPEGKWKEIPEGSGNPALSDATRGFRKSGRIVFSGLVNWEKTHIPVDITSGRPLFWIRCRVCESHFEYPPRIRTARPNTVPATQGRVIVYRRDSPISDNSERTGNGLPDQVFPLRYMPVEYRSLQLAVIDEFDDTFDWGCLSGDPLNPVLWMQLYRFLHCQFSIDWILQDTVVHDPFSDADDIIKISHGRSFVHLIKNEGRSIVQCFLDDGRSQTYSWLEGQILSDSIWDEVADFDGSGPDDRHFVVDYKTGEVRFGDGRFGKVPEPDSCIRFIRYRICEGEAGNIRAGQKWSIEDPCYVPDPEKLPDVKAVPWITNIHDAHGGTGWESIDDAFSRVRHDLKIPYTAVTSVDFETIACRTPGLRVARARSFTTDCTDPDKQKACVTVVVVPFTPLVTFAYPPAPSDEFLSEVCRHIDRHRLLGTTLTVTGPEYIRVSVDVTIVPADGYPDETVQSAVTDRLVHFLHPITGGLDLDGWPIGRMVARSELYELLDETEGVNCVIQMSISGDGGATSDTGNLVISDKATVYPGTMTVHVTRKALQCRKTWRKYG